MRYRLLCEGNVVGTSHDSLALIDLHWHAIRKGWDKGWVLDDTRPAQFQHCSVWTVHWSTAYNGVELSPLIGTR
jgi:hypothetical protein